MKISEIQTYIFKLENEIIHYKDMIHRELYTIVNNVISSDKEFLKYENGFYKWLKSYKDTYMLINDIKINATYEKGDIVKLHINNNSTGWDMTVEIVEVPKKLLTCIAEKI